MNWELKKSMSWKTTSSFVIMISVVSIRVSSAWVLSTRSDSSIAVSWFPTWVAAGPAAVVSRNVPMLGLVGLDANVDGRDSVHLSVCSFSALFRQHTLCRFFFTLHNPLAVFIMIAATSSLDFRATVGSTVDISLAVFLWWINVMINAVLQRD